MKILNNSTNNKFSFGRRPNDSTYWLLKNPQSGMDEQERVLAQDFIKKHPNWEKDEALVHRLKQDTMMARALGKINTEWHKWHIYPIINIPLSIFAFIYGTAMLVKNKGNFTSLKKMDKFLYPFCIIGGIHLTAESIKYIITGRHLFEKKKDSPKTQPSEKA